MVNATMYNIYDEDGLAIDICYSYAYFEVFGLTEEEFEKLENYYNTYCKDGSDYDDEDK